MVTLKLKEASAAKKITYLKEMNWSQDKLLMGANGIAALTFCDVPIAEKPLMGKTHYHVDVPLRFLRGG